MQEILDGCLERKIADALGFIRGMNGAVVALSAGVDSSLVAFLSKKALGKRTIAVTGVSESLSSEELSAAKRVAAEIGVRHLIVETDELSNPSYLANSGDRCYHCKRTLYDELSTIANQYGYDSILDGTQTDDLTDTRPGLRAAREAGVKSPLLHAGFNKKDVRAAARSYGLSVWDKPAMPCLSSRLPTGEAVTVEKLKRIDSAEAFVRKVTGARDLRVRYDHGAARLELMPEERHVVFREELMDQIDRELRRIGFSNVVLDLRGYSRNRKSVLSHELLLPMSTDQQSVQ